MTVPDRQIRQNNTSKAMKNELLLESEPTDTGQDSRAKAKQGTSL
jgi:hypothetical protein